MDRIGCLWRINGSTISALGQGDIKVDLLLGNKYTTITLKNTLYTPRMALTLISITAVGFTVQFKNNACKIISPALKWKIITSIAQVNGLYAIPTQMEESAHVAKLTINELHCALGHIVQDAVQYTVGGAGWGRRARLCLNPGILWSLHNNKGNAPTIPGRDGESCMDL
jgi:hypothetical protein